MAANGSNQREIAQSLGVSLMTYHRWRKFRYAGGSAETLAASRADFRPARDETEDLNAALGRLKELETENSRLRKLVTDLLLQKVQLEEEAAETQLSARGSGKHFAFDGRRSRSRSEI